jgi:hypothetical protein
MTAQTLADRVAALADAGRLTPAQVAEAARRGWIPQEQADAASLIAAQTAETNRLALIAKAAPALAANATYLALSAPTTAQNTAQIKALTRQVNTLIRLAARALDSTSGT